MIWYVIDSSDLWYKNFYNSGKTERGVFFNLFGFLMLDTVSWHLKQWMEWKENNNVITFGAIMPPTHKPFGCVYLVRE